MNRILKLALCIIMMLSTILTTGCWNYIEINNMAIVSAVAIDKGDGEGKYKVSVEVYNIDTAISKQGIVMPVIFSKEGDTIYEAITSIISEAGKKLYFSHCKSIILSEEIAREGILPIMDFISRTSQFRLDVRILIAKETKAVDILMIAPKLERMVGNKFNNIILSDKYVSENKDVQLYTLIKELISKGKAISIPGISIKSHNGRKTTEIIELAIFKGDKLIGWIDHNEALYLAFVSNKVREALLVIKNVSGTTDSVSIKIYSNHTTLNARIEEGVPKINISVRAECVIGEIIGQTDFISDEGIIKLTKSAESFINADIMKLIEKAQKEYESDIFGFGDAVKIYLPQVWHEYEANWENYFTDIEYSIDCKLDIKGSELISKPIKLGE